MLTLILSLTFTLTLILILTLIVALTLALMLTLILSLILTLTLTLVLTAHSSGSINCHVTNAWHAGHATPRGWTLLTPWAIVPRVIMRDVFYGHCERCTLGMGMSVTGLWYYAYLPQL